MTPSGAAENHEVLRRARSFLFVPGDRPGRFERALSSGSDVVVVDLEDAVAPAAKEAALNHVLELLTRSAKVVVRINDPRTARGAADLDGLATAGIPVAVMVPKAEDADTITRVRRVLGTDVPVLPLVETAAGVLRVVALADTPGVTRLVFGHLDLCAELSLGPDDLVRLAPARFALVAASAAAGLPAPVDGVCTEVRDGDRILTEARQSVDGGFTGKLCIHPDQVPFVHQALAPGMDELAWARKVLETTTENGVELVDGRMVDRPVYLRARSIVDRAGAPTK
jgi:citrate lyase subunit beta/citryl-CoA lyase